jgi:hypothetical protein
MTAFAKASAGSLAALRLACQLKPRSGEGWCRLRESNTRPPRYEGGALPSELSRRKNSETQLPVGGGLRGVGSRIRASKDARERAYALDRSCRVERKIDKWSAAALLQSRATLQQGLPLRRERDAAGQFWTFTMSNSGRKTSTFAGTMNPGVELRMHVFLTRIASGDARHRRHVSDARVRSRTTRVQRWRKPLFSELFRAIWSLLPVGGGFWPAAG